MPRKKESIPFVEAMRKLHEAGLDRNIPPNEPRVDDWDQMPTLESRLNALLNIVTTNQRPATNMLFFVMYDIESNKVRRIVVRYLQKKGCVRVQKSIFLADQPVAIFEQIKSDLAEVQACYDNHDSILIVPISTDYLRSMKIIGQDIALDVIIKSKNTLFF